MIIILQEGLSTYRVLFFEQYLFVKEQTGWQKQFHTFDTQIIIFFNSMEEERHYVKQVSYGNLGSRNLLQEKSMQKICISLPVSSESKQ